MPRDYQGEAFEEHEAREAGLRWVRARVEAIRKNVSAHDILRRNGVQLRYAGDREEQFACPFHGVDRHPSARVYPETVKGPSHVWCFTCHENWDAIRLWGKFTGGEQKFTRLLTEIERAFGITPPERPPTAAEMADYVDPEAIRIDLMFSTCEASLRSYRAAFALERKAHLTIGSILDRARYQYEHGLLSAEKVQSILSQVLDKINMREQLRTLPAPART